MNEYGIRKNDTDKVQTEECGEKPVSLQLCPLQIPYGLA